MAKSIFSFFAGAGLLDLGFEAEKYNIVFVNEYEQSFLNAYIYARQQRPNFAQPRYGYHQGDINQYLQGAERDTLLSNIQRERKRHNTVGFIGGPPCPDFSVAGKNKGKDGKNGILALSYYFAQDDSIGKLIAIANLIERQEETEEFDDDPCELSDINTFEAFDTKVNNYHQPVEPGDIFHTDNDKILIVVGQACDMAMGESRTRRNGLCELVEAKFEVSVSSEKIHEDQKHFWINHYKKDDVWGALKIDYQKRYFVENEILSLSSFNSDGNCKIDLASETISDPVLQQYQINMFADMKNFFQSVVSINDYCGDAASSVLANKNINWVISLLDYKKEGSTLLYPLRRTCRLKEKYLLFLYKLFLEYRGRIPFNTVNMNRTVTIPMDFQYNQDSFSNSVDVLLKRSNCDIKTTWPWIVYNSTIKDILSKIQSSVSIKKEQDNYIIEGNKLDIDLSNGKKLRLTKKTRTSISITIV